MEFIQQINWQGILAFIVTIWGGVTKIHNWLMKNQEIINAIILRIEKDASQGWSNSEKKQFAIDMYNNYLKKRVPWYLRPVIKIFILPRIESYIDKTCTISHSFKEDIKKMAI